MMLFEYCFLSISVIARLAYVNAFTSRRRVFSVHGTPFTHLTKKANRAFITFHDIRKLVSSVPEKQKVANADDNFSLFCRTWCCFGGLKRFVVLDASLPFANDMAACTKKVEEERRKVF